MDELLRVPRERMSVRTDCPGKVDRSLATVVEVFIQRHVLVKPVAVAEPGFSAAHLCVGFNDTNRETA